MSVRIFRDLVAWQLSYELKCEVFARAQRGYDYYAPVALETEAGRQAVA
jgi:hypothetical protein